MDADERQIEAKVWALVNETYETGMNSIAQSGSAGINKNLSPTQNDGANIALPISKNSQSFSLLKQPGSMLNAHLITVSVV